MPFKGNFLQVLALAAWNWEGFWSKRTSLRVSRDLQIACTGNVVRGKQRVGAKSPDRLVVDRQEDDAMYHGVTC